MDKELQSFYKGINTDVTPLVQPDGTYRYALNAIVSNDTDMVLANEGSNVSTSKLPEGYSAIGSIYIGDDTSIVFSCTNNESEIGKLDKKGIYTTLVNTPNLKFSKSNPIFGTYRSKINGVANIYWVDGLNKPRCLDLNNLDSYYSIDYLKFLSTPISSRNEILNEIAIEFVNSYGTNALSIYEKISLVYSKLLKRGILQFELDAWIPSLNVVSYKTLVYTILSTVTNDDDVSIVNTLVNNYHIPYNDKWDVNKFDLIKTYKKIPRFDNVEVTENGSIKPGSYSFAIQYLDDNLNTTNWVTTSNPIVIFNDQLNNNYSKIRGSRNINTHIMSYGVTSKSITLTMSNFDTNYPYYRIAVIQANAMTGIANNVLISEIISTNESIFTYTGNDTSLTTGSLNDIAINKEEIETASCIEQLSNRLLLANGSGKDVDYTSFQKYASKISSHLTTKKVYLNSITSKGNPKNPTSTFDSVGYMPGEVYSFGIVYIFDDGTESPVFHIPGRNKNESRPLIDEFNDNLDYYENDNSFYPEIHKEIGVRDYWGIDSYGEQLVSKNKRFHKFPTRSSRGIPLYEKTDDTVEIYKHKLTCTISLKDSTEYPTNALTGESLLINVIAQYLLKGSLIPNEYSFIISDSVKSNPMIVEVYVDTEELSIIADNIYGSISGDIERYSDLFNITFSYTSELQEKISPAYYTNILGINFQNVECPDPRVVAYYIVRNKKEDYDKCVIDNAVFGNTATQTFGAVTYNVFNKWTSVVDGELVSKDNVLGSGNPRDISNNTLYFYSPEHQFLNKNFEFEHIEIYGTLTTERKMTSVNNGEPPNTGSYDSRRYSVVIADAMAGTSFNPDAHAGSDSDGFNLVIGYRNINPNLRSNTNNVTWSYDENGNSTIEEIMYLNAADNKVYNGITYYNASQDNKIGLIKFSDEHPLFTSENKTSIFGSSEHRILYYGAMIKKNAGSYSNFMDRNYYKEHNNPVYFKSNGIGNTINIFHGDAYVNAMSPVASTYFGMKMANRAKKDKTSSKILGVALVIVAVALTIASAGALGPVSLPFAVGGSAAAAMALSAGASMISAALALENLQQMLATDYPIGLQATICDLNMSEHANSEGYGCGLKDGTVNSDDAIMVFSDRLTDLFIESSVNVSLRTSLTTVDTDFINPMNSTKNTFNLATRDLGVPTGLISTLFRQLVLEGVIVVDGERYVNLDGFDEEEFRGYLTSKWTLIDPENRDGRLYRGYASTEWYDINPDYTRTNNEKVFIHLPVNYQPVKKGVVQYPNRIWYSEESFQDEVSDNFQRFLPNNYKDMEQELGSITHLFRVSFISLYRSIDNLYVQTTGGLWKWPKEIQEKASTTDLSTYIGTGEFLSLNPIKVNNCVGGLKYRRASYRIEEGLVFVDDINRSVYLFDGEKLHSISKQGMDGFFIDALSEHMSTQLLNIGYDIGDTKVNGIDILLGYDKNNSRLLVTKNDYEFIDTSDFKGVFDNNNVNYEINNIVLMNGDFKRITKIVNTELSNITLANAIADDSTWVNNNDGSYYHSSELSTNVRLNVPNLELGKCYTVTYTISGMGSGCELLLSLGNNSGTPRKASATYTENLVLSDSDAEFIFSGNGLFTISDLKITSYDITTKQLSLNDSELFINRSFTASYGLKTGGWLSFHSYLPYFYISTPNMMYTLTSDRPNYINEVDYGYTIDTVDTVIDCFSVNVPVGTIIDCGTIAELSINNYIYKHNIKGNYGNYYGITYPFVLEAVSNDDPTQTKTWRFLELNTLSRKYDNTTDQYYVAPQVFNEVIMYNTRQCSGPISINDTYDSPYSFNQGAGEALAINRETTWRINDLRNNLAVNGVSMFTKDWSAIKDVYPVDKVINPEAIDYNKDWFDIDMLRDKFLCVRLTYNNENNDVNMIVNHIGEKQLISLR